MDGKWLHNSDGAMYCGGECVFKVWEFIQIWIPPFSSSTMNCLMNISHESYSKPAICLQFVRKHN